MRLTSAQKSQRHRERRLGVNGNMERLHAYVSVDADAKLRRLARLHNCTLADVIAALANGGERRASERLENDPEALRAYLAPLPEKPRKLRPPFTI